MKISIVQKHILYVLSEAEEEDLVCLVNPVFEAVNIDRFSFFKKFNKAIIDLYENEMLFLSKEYYHPNKEKAYIEAEAIVSYFPLEKLLLYKENIGWVGDTYLIENPNLVFILSDKGKKMAEENVL